MKILLSAILSLAIPAAGQVCVKDRATGKLKCMSAEQYEVRLSAPSSATLGRLRAMARPVRAAVQVRAPLQSPVHASSPGYRTAMRLAREVRRKPSRAIGPPHNGRLLNAARLPLKGYGWVMLHPRRKRNFGTDGLVAGLIQVAAGMKKSEPAIADLAIGDLSAKNGGDIGGHKSHENGLDVDIAFYWTDPLGQPLQTNGMVRFDARGRSGRGIRFDTARNWRLAKTILTNPTFGSRVQYLFVAERLERLLLAHARSLGENAALIRRAAKLMVEPKNSSDHSDHYHLRIRPVPALDVHVASR